MDNSIISKINELRVTAASEKPHLMIYTEIKPKHGAVPDIRNFNIQGYTLYTNSLDDSDVRGVCIYVQNCFKSSSVSISGHNFKDQVTVSIQTHNSSILVQGIYRSGTRTKACTLDPDLRTLLNKSAQLPGFNQKITVGDFNFSNIDWTPEPVLPDHISEESPEAKFVETLRDTFVTQHIDQFTRYPYNNRQDQSPTKDDLLLSTYETDISNLQYEAGFGGSDHVKVKFDINLRNSISISTMQRKILRYNRGNYDEIRKMLDVNWDDKFKDKSPQECIELFEDCYNEAVKKHIPSSSTTCSEQVKPKWMSRTTWSKVRQKHAKWIKYLNTKQPKDYEEYAKVRNEVTHSNYRERKDYEKQISRDVRKNPKGVRTYMKSTNTVKASIPHLTTKSGEKTTNDHEIAEALSDQYSSVFTDENLSDIPLIPPKPLKTPTLNSFVFQEKRIEKLLLSLDVNKAPGLDQIHPRVLKETAKTIAHPIAIIFRKSQGSGILPTQWLKAAITPIFKKGDRSDPANYRPVSLTCILCKVMERIVVEQLLQHVKANSLQTKDQHGFVPGKSITTNLLEVLNKWTEALMHDIPVDILFLDYSKAFDTVPHARLINQVESFGVGGEALRWIKSFLTGREQQVIANNCGSSWQPVKSGIPQGSVLGPVLFSLFVNDVPSLTTNSVTMFADDTKLHAALTDPNTSITLQDDLNKLEEWAQQMQMKFHPKKCKVMHLGNKNPDYDYKMTTDEGTLHTLEEAIIEKDLGVHISWSLGFTYHWKQKTNIATRMLNYVRRSFHHMDKELFLLLYKALVRPHLEFASTVCAPAQKFNQNAIEKVQRRATRMVPELKHMRYKQRLQELGLETLAYRRKRADLLEAFRILNNQHEVDQSCNCTICPGKSMFEPATITSTRGNSKKMYVHPATGPRQNYFATRVIPMWNSLSERTVNSATIEEFKRNLRTDIGHSAYDYDW